MLLVGFISNGSYSYPSLRPQSQQQFDQCDQVEEEVRTRTAHHDPDHDDEFLERIEKLCQEGFPNAVLAREGMEISIGEAT